jgi:hypothetical protein
LWAYEKGDLVVVNGKNKGYSNSKENVVELVYSIIKSCKSNRITTKQIEEAIGSKHKVRYAINHLLKENRIKRIRLLGINRIEYSYKIHSKNI